MVFEDGDADIIDKVQDHNVNDPIDDCIRNEQISIMREAIRDILKNENNQCLNDILTVKFREFPVFLDCLSEFRNEKIIQNYKETKVTPFLKDIYLEYNNVQPQSAGPSAKRLSNEFEMKLREKVKSMYNKKN